MTETLPNLATGGRRARKHVDEMEAARKPVKLNYLTLKDGETKFIRFLTDEPDLIEVLQHSFVPTRSVPEGYENKDRKWPQSMGAVCRYTQIPTEEGYRNWYDDCYICDHMTQTRTKKDNKTTYQAKYNANPRLWAWAVEREMAEDSDGRVTFKDRLVDGKPHYVLVNFGMQNFWDLLLEELDAMKTDEQTLLRNDWKITRQGEKTETQYDITPRKPVEVNGKIFDLRDPEFADTYQPPKPLIEVIAQQASSEYYDRWFNPEGQVNFSTPDEEKTEASAESASETEDVKLPNQETLESMRNRYGFK